MEQRIKRPLTYRLHEASGQARCTLNGKDHYLGRYGSQASRDRYDQLIGQWLASGRSPSFGATATDITIVELVRDYAVHCRQYYGNGHTSELHRVIAACALLKRLYKDLPACQFGPQEFRFVREAMIKTGWARTTVNKRAKTLVRMFKWGAVEGPLPTSIYDIRMAHLLDYLLEFRPTYKGTKIAKLGRRNMRKTY